MPAGRKTNTPKSAAKSASDDAARTAVPSTLDAGASSSVAASPVEPTTSETAPFWKKPLEELTTGQWESLCDGCGRCCLVKLEDEDTGDIHFTNVTCRLLEAGSCRCSDYPGRKSKVPDCIKLTPQSVREIPWLPPTCAYKLVAEGKDLYPWHHLVSGSRDTVHQAGVSVRGRVGPSEDDVDLEDMLDYIVKWPGMIPKPKKPKP